MKMDSLKIKTYKQSNNPDILVEMIKSGKAILFTGAGFSFGSTNILGNEPLGSESLSHKLSEMVGIPKNDNLMFTSDYFLSKKPGSELISILKNNYTLRSTSDSQNIICALPWRRFYSTNYDLSIEIASNQSQRLVETVDLTHSSVDLYKRNSPLCIHLNGSINALNEDSLNDSFKLSASSYISPESFISSDWFYIFKKDLERAKAIVFIGYSLYDIDIQRILFNDESINDKTYFITCNEPDIELNFTLSKFGKVIPIGTDGFAETDKKKPKEPREYSSRTFNAISFFV